MSALQTSSLHPSVSGFPKRRNMTITQTYYLAHTARGKLSQEASRADHNLRLLVGHANLLDSLMLELAEAEQEQENWFNQSVNGATTTKKQEQDRHIQWADAVIHEEEMDEDDSSDSDSDMSDSDFDDDNDVKMEAAAAMISMHRVSARQIPSADYESDEEDVEDDGQEDYAALSLTKTPSHSQQPPELAHDDDSSSDDDSMPPSPPSTVLPSFTEKQRQQIATTSYYEDEEESQQHAPLSTADQNEFIEKGYYLPQRRTPGLVSAISVY